MKISFTIARGVFGASVPSDVERVARVAEAMNTLAFGDLP